MVSEIARIASYEAGDLIQQIESLIQHKFNGVAYLTPKVVDGQETLACVATFEKGELVYLGNKLPTPNDFVAYLCQKLNPNLADVATKYVSERSGKLSLGDTLNQLVRIGLFSWKQVESFLLDQAIQLLDSIQNLPGQVRIDPSQKFELNHNQKRVELLWADICAALEQRKQAWEDLESYIPAKDAVPILVQKLSFQDIQGIVKKAHSAEFWKQVYDSTDGQQSLVAIAELLKLDALDVARFYAGLVQVGIVKFHGITPPVTTALQTPKHYTVLTVDDSPIVRVMLKRTLSNHYRVLSAEDGAAALKVLGEENIDLAILDVTMPDMNGLELCRLIRQISKYKDLPILMLTARDGYADRFRGHIAGSTKYLTKPINAEKLLQIVQSYLQPQLV